MLRDVRLFTFIRASTTFTTVSLLMTPSSSSLWMQSTHLRLSVACLSEAMVPVLRSPAEPRQLRAGGARHILATAIRRCARLRGSLLPVSQKIKSLDVIIDDHLRFDAHASSTVSSCIYHTCALRHVHRVLSDDTAKSIACSIVISQLDYCNSLLYGAPKTTVDKLQRA